MNGIENRKEEITLSLLADYVIMFVENNQEIYSKNLLGLSGQSKVKVYKINIQKSIIFLYINNGHIHGS